MYPSPSEVLRREVFPPQIPTNPVYHPKFPWQWVSGVQHGGGCSSYREQVAAALGFTLRQVFRAKETGQLLHLQALRRDGGGAFDQSHGRNFEGMP